jgi:hypothetical protein
MLEKKMKSRAAFLIVPLVILLALTACGGGRAAAPEPMAGEVFFDEAMAYPEAEEKAAEMAPPMEPALAEAGSRGVDTSTVDVGVQQEQQQQQIERLIIRNGNITVQAEDTRAAQEKIEGMIAGMASEGAFVVSREEYGGSDVRSPYISMNVRVPVGRFDEAMDFIAGLAAGGTTPTRSESGQDVTAEYVDLEARLESLEAARQRLLEIMNNSQTTEDLLLAEQQLTQREAEIESIKGRMQYLSQSAQLSSIYIELQPYILSQPVDARWRPAETVREALEALVHGSRGFADFMIFFIIAVLPWLVLFGLVIYGIVRFVLWRVRVGREKRAARTVAQGD